MAVRHTTRAPLLISDYYASRTTTRRHTPWVPISYRSMKGFYALNYLLLVLGVVLVVYGIAIIVS